MLVQEHLQLDLYRAKDKSRGQISFKDLTLHEQLQYVKWSLKDTREALQMFEIVKEQDVQGQVACALVHKVSNKTKNLKEGFTDKKEFREIC